MQQPDIAHTVTRSINKVIRALRHLPGQARSAAHDLMNHRGVYRTTYEVHDIEALTEQDADLSDTIRWRFTSACATPSGIVAAVDHQTETLGIDPDNDIYALVVFAVRKSGAREVIYLQTSPDTYAPETLERVMRAWHDTQAELFNDDSVRVDEINLIKEEA